MSLFVKICGLRDAGDVSASVAAGANAIGFVFAESVRRVTPAAARAAAADCPQAVQRVAVMRHPTNDDWLAVLEEFRPDVLQTDAGDFGTLDVPDTITRWPVYREGGSMGTEVGVYVYEGMKSGSGETVDWACAARLAAGPGHMLLAGGLSADNVAAAIRRVRPWGVDVSSGVESAPGRKDAALIREFVGAVRRAERAP